MGFLCFAVLIRFLVPFVLCVVVVSCLVLRVQPLFFLVDGFPSSGFLEGFGWILSPEGLDPRFPSTFAFTVEVFLFPFRSSFFAT